MPGFIGHTTANGIVLLGTTAVMRWQGWSWSDVVAVDAGITIASIVLSIWIVGQISGDGESNWLEGVQLLAVYLILGILFYFLPEFH